VILEIYQKVFIILNLDISIGIRIACNYFFGVGLQDFIKNINENNLKLFDLKNVLKLIGEEYKKKEELLLTIQIDEFQEKEKGEMTLEIANIMSSEHDLGLQIMIFLTGTGDENLLETLNVSRFIGIEILLNPCKSNESKEMVENLLQFGDYINFREKFLEDLVPLCGNIPRLNEIFVSSVNKVLSDTKILSSFEIIMNRVQTSIVTSFGKMYTSSDWDKFLAKNEQKPGTGIANMCLYSLTKKEVSLEDKLNGFTIKKAKNAGILYLTESKKDKYYISLPLVLLDYFNQEYNIFPIEIVHPYEDKNWSNFEDIMMIYRKILNKILLFLDIKKIRFKDLYGEELIGNKNDLETEFEVTDFEIFEGYKFFTNTSSITEFDNSKIPISEDINVNITLGNHMIKNIPLASSFDSVLFHKEITENYQYKSSDYIKYGKPPSIKKDNCITIDYLKKEYNKIIDKKFLDDRIPKLILISNKPFYDFDNLNRSDIPENIMLICNNNFTSCIGKPFSDYNKLFIKQNFVVCCKCKDCNSKKCSCFKRDLKCNLECECKGNNCNRNN
jgi:hypothetical protein